jgi:hypothetical protein
MHEFLNRLGCVGLVTAVVFPFGQQIFPMMASLIGQLQFGAIEAVVAAALGQSLHAALYG